MGDTIAKGSDFEVYRKRLANRTPLIGLFLRWLALWSLGRDRRVGAVALLAEVAQQYRSEWVGQRAAQLLGRRAGGGQKSAQQALCQLVIEYDHPHAARVAVQGGFAPSDIHQRALFLFLTEQWEEYENLDFDQSLLRAAYESGGQALKLRLANKARAAGRTDWADVVTRGRQSRQLADLTEAERDAVTEVLIQGQQWNELWTLAQTAPVVWSAKIITQLNSRGWQPSQPDHAKLFAELSSLAAQCQGDGPGDWQGITTSAREFDLDCACLTISPRGLMATGTGVGGQLENAIQLWDLRTGQVVQTLRGHQKRVTALAVTPNGKVLASGSWDRTVRLWDMNISRRAKGFDISELEQVPEATEKVVLHGHEDWVNCLAISPGGKLLASGSWDRSVRLWRMPSGQELQSVDNTGGRLDCLAIGANGLLASGGEEPKIHLWDLRSRGLAGLLEGHDDAVRALVMTPDSSHLISGGDDGTIRLWNLQTLREIQCLEAHEGPVRALALSPDGRLLASGGDDNTVRLWSFPEGQLLQELHGHQKAVNAMAVSPQGRLLASAGTDHKVRLWPSPVAHLTHLPIQQTSFQDFTWTQQTLDRQDITREERPWLQMTFALMQWRRRAEIEIEEVKLPDVEFDIEIESV